MQKDTREEGRDAELELGGPEGGARPEVERYEGNQFRARFFIDIEECNERNDKKKEAPCAKPFCF